MRRRVPFYWLGCRLNGQTYAYTALGTFKTAKAAADRCREHGALVFETFELFSERGVNYGHSQETVVAVVVSK